MTERNHGELEALVLVAEENYAHARDHEHLRAQVTSTLVAAAFVLIGLALDKQVTEPKLVYVSILAILIGVLNVVLVVIHNNRFDRHVSIAREARSQIAEVKASTPIPKRMSLSTAWIVVACLPVFAGIGLFFVR